MTSAEARKHITTQIITIYDESEAAVMADWVLEHITRKNRMEMSSGKQILLSAEQQQELDPIIARLLQHEPVQYVLNESWFCGLKFYVDNHVLIPRPETEELVEWIITHCKFPVDALKILDIGSGSGCISIALKRRLKKAEVWSCDISPGALAVAKKNATTLGTEVHFIRLDFLEPDAREQLPSFDIIVSNPPYIPEKDKETIPPNVLQYEPSPALFVPDKDPLIFYKAIAEFGKAHLNPKGTIYCEIHEDRSEEILRLFSSCGYITELKKDMQQKYRMLKADYNRPIAND